MSKPSLLRMPDVKQRTGLGRSVIYMLMAKGEFPQKIQISSRCVAWNSDDIDQWIAEKIKKATN